MLEPNIEWYNGKELSIIFNHKPHVHIRYPLPSMTTLEKNAAKRFPFINLRDVRVTLFDHKKSKKYEFVIHDKYCWDGASIPRIFWLTIGSKTDSRFLIPSMIHDVLCENHHYVDNDRYFADKVFERLLYVAGVPAFNRWRMFHSVDNYQKFCGWGKK